jgi:hypothetical protein
VNRTLEPVQLSLWLSSDPDYGFQAGQQHDRQPGGRQQGPEEPG